MLMTAMIALSATVTRAQSTEQTGENRQQESQIVAQGVGTFAPPEPPKTAIVGTWLGTLLSSGTKSLITFNADGTLINSFQGEVSINPMRPPHTSHHGVWRYLGGRQFGLTMWDIFYDINTNQLIQYTKIRAEVTLAENLDEASASVRVDFLNPQGEVVMTRTGSISYKRIQYEPLD
jgi:hypothetical protein